MKGVQSRSAEGGSHYTGGFVRDDEAISELSNGLNSSVDRFFPKTSDLFSNVKIGGQIIRQPVLQEK